MTDTALTAELIGLGIATAVGFLVGLERERQDKPIGLRSFVLIGILGGLSALLSSVTGGWVVAAGLAGLAVLLTFATQRGDQPRGLTTLAAALVVYLLGAAAVAGYWLQTVVLSGAVTLLLHWKAPLHGWVNRIGRSDFEIIARFILMAVVILPLLPNETFGPYDVFNPFEAWLLVVLIVSINLAGYVVLRSSASDFGVWMAGLLGGLISSTATTVSYAAISRRSPEASRLAALVILIASTVVYGRVIIELLVVAPDLVSHIVAPVLAFSGFLLTLCGIGFMRERRETHGGSHTPDAGNPARIRTALTFVVLYVAILFGVAITQEHLGNEAFYGIAAISGLTDVDALTISAGQLYSKGKVEADTAWRGIFLASLANLLFKGGIAGVLGSPQLRKAIAAPVIGALIAGGILLVLWP